MKRVCEYLVFIWGEPQFIMYAGVRTKHDDALHILNKHRGRSLALSDIEVKSRTRVPKKIWEEAEKLQRGGRWHETHP